MITQVEELQLAIRRLQEDIRLKDETIFLLGTRIVELEWQLEARVSLAMVDMRKG